PYVINNKQWTEIGIEMETIICRQNILKEEFQWPSKTYTLTFQEVKKIKDHLFVIDNRASGMRLNDFETNGTKFGRLITSEGRVIGSEWIRRNKDWARINYTVLTRLEIDKWAHLPSAIPEFVTKSFYAQINYFFLYEYMDQKIMLANVTWTNEVNEDSLDFITFDPDQDDQNSADAVAVVVVNFVTDPAVIVVVVVDFITYNPDQDPVVVFVTFVTVVTVVTVAVVILKILFRNQYYLVKRN
ncbi:hypothetical protein RhiirC2_825665, partial [Rhizophagus irregularis]